MIPSARDKSLQRLQPAADIQRPAFVAGKADTRLEKRNWELAEMSPAKYKGPPGLRDASLAIYCHQYMHQAMYISLPATESELTGSARYTSVD